MRRLFIVVATLLASGALAQAQDAAEAFLSRFAGDWHSTTTQGDYRGLGVMSARLSKDRALVQGTETQLPLDQSWSLKGQFTMSQTGKGNSLKMSYRSPNGMHFEEELSFTKEGNTIKGKGKRTGWRRDGAPFTGDVIVSSPDEDHCTWRVTNMLSGVKEEPDLILQFTRAKFEEAPKKK